MLYSQVKTFASVLIAMSLLVTGCSKDVDSETVAYQFVRLYFMEDNVAESVKLTSGSAKAQLEKTLGEIEAVGAKEPAQDKPLVEAILQETHPSSQDEILYVYRVTSDIRLAGMKPVTARLWLSKEGNAWYVSKFVQEE